MPGTNVWVAESAGTIAGFFSLKDERLEHLYVRPGHQGSGVGSALLGKARALSPKRLELYTFLRNQGARRFYERHGFQAVAFGRDNEENEPDVLYEWVPSDAR
jgi:GNAT superfamily N-acetyltransferase